MKVKIDHIESWVFGDKLRHLITLGAEHEDARPNWVKRISDPDWYPTYVYFVPDKKASSARVPDTGLTPFGMWLKKKIGW